MVARSLSFSSERRSRSASASESWSLAVWASPLANSSSDEISSTRALQALSSSITDARASPSSWVLSDSAACLMISRTLPSSSSSNPPSAGSDLSALNASSSAFSDWESLEIYS